MPPSVLGALLIATIAGSVFAAPIAADAPATPFPRPAELAPAVAFWTRVYTKIDTASGYIHDNRHLDVVYQTLYLNPDAPPSAQDTAIEEVLADYGKALRILASGKRHGLNAIQRRALRPWGEDASNAELEAAATRLRFQRGQADRFQQGLIRSRRWKTRIRAIFREQGLPPELASLPHVESSYNPRALSKAGAAGLWQFMPATARRYLRVDQRVDERLDPYRSSQAAAHLLKQNYSILKIWPLAITAYNHGLSGVRRAMRETGTDDLGEIAKTYEGDRFGFASRNFYAAFLAVLDASGDAGRDFRQPRGEGVEPLALLTPAYLPVDVLVAAFDVDKTQLRSLNPSLHHAVWNGTHFVPKNHLLKLPGNYNSQKAEKTLQQLAQHFGFASQKPYRYYEVHLGDSLSKIAETHNTSVSKLVAMNRLVNAHKINAGQILRVPMGRIPEPLGIGAAAVLATQLAAGDLHDSAPLAADVHHAIALVAGQHGPDSGAVDLCKPGALESALVDGEVPGDADTAASPAETQPELAADPVDYSVATDGTIEIQIAETLGHYAEWLGLRSDRLRKLNRLRHKQPLIVGRRLKLEFSRATPGRFQQQRIAYHKDRQLEYFRRYHIAGVLEHRVQPGDNLWLLAVHQYDIPMWLLRQYNPDINIDSVLPLDSAIFVPLIQALSRERPCLLEGVDRDSGAEGVQGQRA